MLINLAEWNVSWLSYPQAHLPAAKDPAAQVLAAKPGSGRWDILRRGSHASQQAHTDPAHPGGAATTGKHVRRVMLYHSCSQANMSASTAAQQCRGVQGHVQAGHGPQAQARQTGFWSQALSTFPTVRTAIAVSFLLCAFPHLQVLSILGNRCRFLLPWAPLARVTSPFACVPVIALVSLPNFPTIQGYL